MDQYVMFNSTYHILICRQCGYAISQNWITRHFRRCHKTIPLTTRQKIIEYGQSLELWQPKVVQDTWNNSNTKFPIEGLTISSGFQCLYHDCSQLTRTEISIQQHCRENHNWLMKDGIMWRTQELQTFFEGPNRRYQYIR